MPTFQNVIDTIKTPQDSNVRRVELIREIEQITGRRLLVYVADPKKPESALTLEDKTGFSDLIQDIPNQAVDVMINSLGGLAEATDSIVGMLRAKFSNVRFAIPNIAKSAATLMALSGNELLMDHRSELGPIDPQVVYPSADGLKREAAEDILDGFREAKEALAREGPAATPAYVPLLNKYTIGLLRGCTNAMQLSRELAETWLRNYMFADEPGSQKPGEIVRYFASHANTLSHGRAIRVDKCRELGLKIADMSAPGLADKLWELWCNYELHFERSPVHKIYENSAGCLLQKFSAQTQIVLQRPPQPGPPQPPGPPRPPTP